MHVNTYVHRIFHRSVNILRHRVGGEIPMYIVFSIGL